MSSNLDDILLEDANGNSTAITPSVMFELGWCKIILGNSKSSNKKTIYVLAIKSKYVEINLESDLRSYNLMNSL